MQKMRIPNDTVADREFLNVDPRLSVAAGAWRGVTHVNKFGLAPSGVQTTTTDVWDRADAAATQQVWIAPGLVSLVSEPLFHNIKSTSNNDGAGLNFGALTLEIYGLNTWDSKESHETIDMNGTTDRQTANKYVIIHRMIVTSYGITGPNIGTITATTIPADAAGPSVTAQINPSEGQTQMAIYGIPSIQNAFLTNWYASMHDKTSQTTRVKLQYCTDPENNPSQFITKETRGLCSDGSSEATWEKNPYGKFAGPGILKVQAISSSADTDFGAGFDLILMDK